MSASASSSPSASKQTPPDDSDAAPPAPRGKRATSLRVVSGLGESPDAPAVGGEKALDLDPRTYGRALDCIHCGLCLPACPTYAENGLEADSPRGRIVLMKNLADGAIEPTDSVLEHLDLCLDCRACETACPSGVVYHELIEETRERLRVARKKSAVDRLVEAMFFRVFPFPTRLKLSMLPVRLLQKAGLWSLFMRSRLASKLPAKLSKMQQMLPTSGPLWERNLAERYPADERGKVEGRPRAVVGLLSGCVGGVLFQPVNRETIGVLTRIGCDVIVPRRQMCCGAIHHHGGKVRQATAMARRNIDVFESAAVDYVVNNAAGCGAMLKDYTHLLRDDPRYASRAETFVKKNRDICELLVELDPPRPTHEVRERVTYHDACHLTHAQRLAEPPRRVLAWIPGLRITALPEAEMCCGAAGTYNLAQPEMARRLAERKLQHIRATNADLCATGNVGCAMQIQSEADRLDMPLRVTHPISLLYRSYCGESDSIQ